MANSERQKAESEELNTEAGQQADPAAADQTGAAGEHREATAAEEAAEAAEAAAEAVEDIGEAEITLEHLQDELAEAKDAALRAQAEAQNARRRADQDVEKARKCALERFASELLPVVDNLERALESAGGDSDEVKGIAEGVQLTLRGLLEALKKSNVEQIDPMGEPFDPQLHQAMSMIENADVEPNSVLQVMQKGYTLSGRLIRPAMVMVSKAPGS